MPLPLVLRIPKGAELTYAELDGNFTLIDDAISAIQAKLAVPPTSSLAVGGPFEKGTTVNPLVITGSITPNDSTVTSRSLKRGATEIFAPVGNNFTFNDTSGISTNTTYTLTTVFSTGTQNASASASFVAPTYTGVGPASPTQGQIKALTKSIVAKASRQFTFSPTNQRYIIAYPSSFGNLVSLIDQNGFNVTDSFTRSTMTFQLADSSSEPYTIYVSNDDTTQVGFKISIAY